MNKKESNNYDSNSNIWDKFEVSLIYLAAAAFYLIFVIGLITSVKYILGLL